MQRLQTFPRTLKAKKIKENHKTIFRFPLEFANFLFQALSTFLRCNFLISHIKYVLKWFHMTVRYYLKWMFVNVIRCAIWYHLYNLKIVKNTHGGVLLLVKLKACNVTKSNTPPWVFFTIFKLYKWYQIAQNISYDHDIDMAW